MPLPAESQIDPIGDAMVVAPETARPKRRAPVKVPRKPAVDPSPEMP
jgi:hypothetical protein